MQVLYGVFWAASPGGRELERDAWGGQFPSQIRVQGLDEPRYGEVLRQAHLPEVTGQKLCSHAQFGCGLTRNQVTRLVELILPLGKGTAVGSNDCQFLETAEGAPTSETSSQKKSAKPVVLRLDPAKPARSYKGSRRGMFERLRGYRVVLDSSHPVTHYSPPPRHDPGLLHQSDHMEIETTEHGFHVRPTVEEAPVKRKLDDLTAATVPSPSVKEGPPSKQHSDYNRPKKKLAKVKEAQWSLGEYIWESDRNFRSFLLGDEPSFPPPRAAPASRRSAAPKCPASSSQEIDETRVQNGQEHETKNAVGLQDDVNRVDAAAEDGNVERVQSTAGKSVMQDREEVPLSTPAISAKRTAAETDAATSSEPVESIQAPEVVRKWCWVL